MILTSVPSYPVGRVPAAFRKRLVYEEGKGDEKVFRTSIFPFEIHSTLERIIAYLFFTVSTLVFLSLHGRKRFMCDAYILSSPPVTMSILAPFIGIVFRRPYFNDVRDLWPEALQGTYIGSSGPIARMVQMLQLYGLRQAKAVGTVTPGLMRRVERTMKLNHISRPLYYIPNGVDLGKFRPLDGEEGERRLGPPGSEMVLYSGIIGRSQKLENIVEAFRRVADERKNAVLYLIGRGDAEASVRAAIARNGLGERVRLIDPVPRSELMRYIHESKVCLVPLHENQVDALTTKFFEYLACERPVIATSSRNLQEILSESGAGIFVSINDLTALAASMTRLLEDDSLGKKMGRQGRAFLEKSIFNRTESANTLAKAITNMVVR